MPVGGGAGDHFRIFVPHDGGKWSIDLQNFTRDPHVGFVGTSKRCDGAGGEAVIVLVAMHRMVMMVPIALAVVINVVMVAIVVMDVARTGSLDIGRPSLQ